MIEVWKAIPGYAGSYEASTFGSIRNAVTGYTFKPTMASNGYLVVHILGKNHYVHRLIADTFLANKGNAPQVNHRDGNKANNTVSNLEWVTAANNTRHAIKTGLRKQNRAVRQYTLTGEYVTTYDSIKDAQQAMGAPTSNSITCALTKGYQRAAYGYAWKYANNSRKD